jgi:hypothetical protein
MGWFAFALYTNVAQSKRCERGLDVTYQLMIDDTLPATNKYWY